MRQIEFLALAINALERLDIRYAVVGSYASTAWGEPRMTLDIDIVVEMAADQVQAFCIAFPEQDFYVSRTAAMEAVQHRSQFNLIHPASGNKIDFMIAGSGDWAQSQLSRRRKIEFEPTIAGYVAAPEDVILGKLIYYRDGASEKHLRDIRGILKVSRGSLDRQYIAQRAEQLGVSDAWAKLLSEILKG
jgi:hypothetical protein